MSKQAAEDNGRNSDAGPATVATASPTTGNNRKGTPGSSGKREIGTRSVQIIPGERIVFADLLLNCANPPSHSPTMFSADAASNVRAANPRPSTKPVRPHLIHSLLLLFVAELLVFFVFALWLLQGFIPTRTSSAPPEDQGGGGEPQRSHFQPSKTHQYSSPVSPLCSLSPTVHHHHISNPPLSPHLASSRC
jgi:hypothetical protein